MIGITNTDISAHTSLTKDVYADKDQSESNKWNTIRGPSPLVMGGAIVMPTLWYPEERTYPPTLRMR
jgi:hypothetical protein